MLVQYLTFHGTFCCNILAVANDIHNTFLHVVYSILNALTVILKRNKMRLKRNEKYLKKNETHLWRNKMKSGNLHLNSIVQSCT